MTMKERAPRNRTVTLDDAERDRLKRHLKTESEVHADTVDATVLGNCVDVAARLSPASVDMLFLTPPYNLTKRFGNSSFTKQPVEQYTDWLRGVLDALLPTVKQMAQYTSAVTGTHLPPSSRRRLSGSTFATELPGNARRGAARKPTGKTQARISGSARWATTTHSTLIR